MASWGGILNVRQIFTERFHPRQRQVADRSRQRRWLEPEELMSTTGAHAIAMSLLRRLLDGERGELPMCLGYLLERASSMRDSDRFYRSVLPRELADVRLSPETRLEVIAALCSELLRNPDAALITVLSFSEEDLSIRAVASVLLNPPRCLTMGEFAGGLCLLKSNLPGCLGENSEFISIREVEELIRLATKLRDIAIDEGETDRERSLRNEVKIHSEYLIHGLTQAGFSHS